MPAAKKSSQNRVSAAADNAARSKAKTVVAPKKATIAGQPHMLAYINKDERRLLKSLGGADIPGPAGIRAFPPAGAGGGGTKDGKTGSSAGKGASKGSGTPGGGGGTGGPGNVGGGGAAANKPSPSAGGSSGGSAANKPSPAANKPSPSANKPSPAAGGSSGGSAAAQAAAAAKAAADKAAADKAAKAAADKAAADKAAADKAAADRAAAERAARERIAAAEKAAQSVTVATPAGPQKVSAASTTAALSPSGAAAALSSSPSASSVPTGLSATVSPYTLDSRPNETLAGNMFIDDPADPSLGLGVGPGHGTAVKVLGSKVPGLPDAAVNMVYVEYPDGTVAPVGAGLLSTTNPRATQVSLYSEDAFSRMFPVGPANAAASATGTANLAPAASGIERALPTGGPGTFAPSGLGSLAPTSSPRPEPRPGSSATPPSTAAPAPAAPQEEAAQEPSMLGGILGTIVESALGPLGSILGVGNIVENIIGNIGSGGGGGGAAPVGGDREGGGGGGGAPTTPAPAPVVSPVQPPPPSNGPTSCPPGFQLYTYPDGSTTCFPITSSATMVRPVAAPYYQPVGGEAPQGYAQMSSFYPQLTPVIDRGQGLASLQQSGALPQFLFSGLGSLAN